MVKETARRGKYVGELRRRFNIIEQWDGYGWGEPPEVGIYGASPMKLHFDVDEPNDPYAGNEAFLPKS